MPTSLFALLYLLFLRVISSHKTTLRIRSRMAVASSPDQAEYGGYNFTFTKPVPKHLHCSICNKVLCDPHLTECCGHHFCKSCLDHRFKKTEDNLPTLSSWKLYPHNQQRTQTWSWRTWNPMHQSEYGCQWVGGLNSLQTHLNSDEGCGYIEVQCTNNCGAKMKRKELKAHLAQICSLRKFQCLYCHYEQTITTQHYKECLSYPLPCPNKCSTTDIRREEMNNHRRSC